MKAGKRKKIQSLRRHLLAWYRKNQRNLPWHGTKDPYLIWVSEVMLQQTRVDTVKRYFPEFIKRFPTILHLSQASLDNVLKVWEGMGYYARARNLHKSARQLWDLYQNSTARKPQTKWDFTSFFQRKIARNPRFFFSLPGVGENIGAMVFSVAFNHPYAIQDANAMRVISRWFAVPLVYPSLRFHKAIRQIAESLLPQSCPGDWNQAVLELGETICLPRKPKCTICPVFSFCSAYQTGAPGSYPKRKKKKAIPFYTVVAGVIQNEGKILITKRKEEGLLGGLWEFPGGKVEEGETPEQALIRELREELQVDVKVGHFLLQIPHRYTHFCILLKVYEAEILSRSVHPLGVADYRWVLPSELSQFAFPSADRKILAYLKQKMIQ